MRRGQDIESIGGWVRVVALNIARDHFRRRALERKHAATMLAIPSADAPSDWRLDVRAAIEALPQRQREVAVLHLILDLPISEIARELRGSGIDFVTLDTSSPLDAALVAYLDARSRRP